MTSIHDVTRTDGRCTVAAVLGRDGQVARGPTTITVTDGVIASLRPATDPNPTLVAMPPLVNSHDHGRGRGLTDAGIADGPLEVWLPRLASDRRSQTELVGDAAAVMARNGIGAAVFCVNPMTADLEAEIRYACAAARCAGVRAAVVVPLADVADRMRTRNETGWDTGQVAARLAMVTRLRAQECDTLVDVQLGPVGPQWVSEPTLRAVVDHARAHGLRMHMHLLESPAQRAWADEIYPEGLLTWLDGIALLGPHTWFAHGTQLRADELSLLAERGCGLALNASSNLRLCSGFAPVSAATHAGVGTGMGLDGLSLNEDNDPWTELRLLRGLAQAQSHQTASAAEILALGFNVGALGSQQPKPIAEGQPADFLTVDIAPRIHLLERTGWSIADIVLVAPLSVHTLWVAGRAVHQTLPTPVPVSIGELT